MTLNILYEDASVQVVEKPAGLDMEELQEKLEQGFSPAHRLDKDTSGVLLAAKNQEALEYLQRQFRARKVKKTYLALVEGRVRKDGKIETLLGRSPNDRRQQKVFLQAEPGAEGKREAVTEYRVKQEYKGYTLLEVSPKTGRKHQIRAHMQYLSHPIAGDELYGFKGQKAPEGLKRQFLHASSLTITLSDEKERTFTSPLPEDLQDVLKNI